MVVEVVVLVVVVMVVVLPKCLSRDLFAEFSFPFPVFVTGGVRGGGC